MICCLIFVFLVYVYLKISLYLYTYVFVYQYAHTQLLICMVQDFLCAYDFVQEALSSVGWASPMIMDSSLRVYPLCKAI